MHNLGHETQVREINNHRNLSFLLRVKIAINCIHIIYIYLFIIDDRISLNVFKQKKKINVIDLHLLQQKYHATRYYFNLPPTPPNRACRYIYRAWLVLCQYTQLHTKTHKNSHDVKQWLDRCIIVVMMT